MRASEQIVRNLRAAKARAQEGQKAMARFFDRKGDLHSAPEANGMNPIEARIAALASGAR